MDFICILEDTLIISQPLSTPAGFPFRAKEQLAEKTAQRRAVAL
jgi:hypothetical protein